MLHSDLGAYRANALNETCSNQTAVSDNHRIAHTLKKKMVKGNKLYFYPFPNFELWYSILKMYYFFFFVRMYYRLYMIILFHAVTSVCLWSKSGYCVSLFQYSDQFQRQSFVTKNIMIKGNVHYLLHLYFELLKPWYQSSTKWIAEQFNKASRVPGLWFHKVLCSDAKNTNCDY